AVLSFASRPELKPTAGELMARVGEVMRCQTDVVTRQLRRNDVEILRGNATFVDPHHVAISSRDGEVRTVGAENILAACGSRPDPPPGVASDGALVVTSDDICNLKQLPRSMVVVGAGVIGMEFASIFSVLGIAVTIVERRERPLEFLDGEIVDELMHQ